MIPPWATALTTACEVQLCGVPLPITWSGLEVFTAWAAIGTGKSPSGFPGEGRSRAGGLLGVRLRARVRKVAIWSRVILWSGQNRLLVGGLHPAVIPAAANRLIADSKIWPLSSTKRF